MNDPGTPAASTVALTGSTGISSSEVTSVVYVLDATNSTALQDGMDCSGNGVESGEDDLNGDGRVGDTLDCEIAGVVALDTSLAATSRLQVGLVGFANEAAAADLDPGAGTATFVPAGYPEATPPHGSTASRAASCATRSGSTTPGRWAAAGPVRRSTAPSRQHFPHSAPRPRDRSGSCSCLTAWPR